MIKHAGIYVNDLKAMENFYQDVFDMYYICQGQKFEHGLMNDLLKSTGITCKITKLITEYGKKTGIGDMLELIEVDWDKSGKEAQCSKKTEIWENTHVAFEVNDMTAVIEKIIKNGGKQKTEIHDMGNGRLCCFCTDPENNWIELIASANIS